MPFTPATTMPLGQALAGANAEIAAFIDGECRGAAVADTDGEQPLYYLLVAGEGSGQPIQLQASVDGQVIALRNELTYVSDGNIGTPWEPLVIDVYEALQATGISDIADGEADGKSAWFILQGIRYGSKKPTTSGVYIRNGKKQVIK